MTQARCLWEVRSPRSAQEECTLLLLPHSGGSAQSFAGWAPHFPAPIRLIAAQYPGRGSRRREPVAAHLCQLAEEIVAALSEVTGPVAVFGHSLGAFVGFETCWMLEAAGQPPLMFFASGAVPVHEHEPYETSPSGLTDEEMLKFLNRYGRMAAGITAHPEIRQLALAACRADSTLAHDYTYGPAQRLLTVPIIGLGGDADPVVPVSVLRHWAELTSGSHGIHTFAGAHFYHEDHLAAVSAVIIEYVRRATRSVAIPIQ